MISLKILQKAALIALVLLVPTAIIYKFASIHAVTIFILNFIISLKDFATLKPKQSIILGLTIAVLLAAATFAGTNALWLPVLVGIAGLVSIYANRTAGGIFGIAPAYVAVVGFLVTGGSHWVVLVFALLGFAYAFLVQHLTKITFKHHAMNKRTALQYGLFLAITGAASTWISIQLSAPHPYWFVLAAIMVLHPKRVETFKVMWKRSLATIVGAFIAIAVLHFLPTPFIIVVALIAATLFFCYLLLSKYFAQITLITILLLLILSIDAHDTSDDLSFARAWLTLAGTAFAAALYSIGILVMRFIDSEASDTTVKRGGNKE